MKLAGFQLSHKLGDGILGPLYAAVESSTQRRTVVRILPDDAAGDPAVLTNLQGLARALTELEWVFTHPIAGGQQPRVEAMFALAGVAPPTRVVVTETQAGLALIRNADAAAVAPRMVLGVPETQGIVAVPDSPLRPGDLEVQLLSRPDVPMTPAAAYFAHCLSTVVNQLQTPPDRREPP